MLIPPYSKESSLKKERKTIDYAKLITNICYTSHNKPISMNEALKNELYSL